MNSRIAARNVGKLTLGTILTLGASQEEGIAADKIAAFNAITDTGKALKFVKLDTDAAFQSILSSMHIDLADFQVVLI